MFIPILSRLGLAPEKDPDNVVTRALYMAEGIALTTGNIVEETAGFAAAKILMATGGAEADLLAATLVLMPLKSASMGVLRQVLSRDSADIMNEANDVVLAHDYKKDEAREWLDKLTPRSRSALMAHATARIEDALERCDKLELTDTVPYTVTKDDGGRVTSTRTVAAELAEMRDFATTFASPSAGKTGLPALDDRFTRSLASLETRLGLNFGRAFAFSFAKNRGPGGPAMGSA